jgi:hypothetical protein
MKTKALLIVAFLLATVRLPAPSVEWDPIPDQRVTKYRLFVGEKSGVYTQTKDVPSTTNRMEITEFLIPGKECYMVVAGVTGDGIVGEYSNELAIYKPSGPIIILIP